VKGPGAILFSAARLAAAGLAALALGCGRPPAESLVVISLDTVRRDHLPTWGYARATAPRLDAFARRAVVFDNAIAQHVNTGPSHASLFTGLYPHTHGSVFNGSRLAERHATLAQLLARTGIRTAGFASGAALRAGVSGLERGFEHWDEDFAGGRRDGRETVRRALGWLAQRAPGERFFLFVHLYDPHGPYHPPASHAALFRSPDPGPALPRIPHYQKLADAAGVPLVHLNDYVDRYDALLRYSDDRLGELFDAIDLSRSAVVVLADHGESLGERWHALDHGGQVFDEEIRIPLVVHAPGLAARRVPDLVESVDLLPTLLDLLGLAAPQGLALQGESLLPLLEGRARGAGEGAAFASARALPERHADRGYALEPSGQIHALRTPRWKLVLYPGAGREWIELYDLAADPGERANLAEREPARRDELLARLRGWMALGSAAQTPAQISPELRRHLEALGYSVP
jgi:arylsulfatase A-like enzyme